MSLEIAIEEARKKRNEYWALLAKVKDEYLENVDASQGQFSRKEFVDYIERNYGIKITINDGGFITDTFDIVDETLYMLFILKWT
jgi:hypothetical protein